MNFMSKAQKLLFVCYQNRSRSLTAERLLRGYPGYVVKSAGTAPGARTHVTKSHIRWADRIFVMEEVQARDLKEHFGEALSTKPVICLGIPDKYRCMEPALIDKLKTTLSKHLNAPELKAS
jgi:predicted protein tyrosine phosphatase